jgi:hypothetical protein
MAHCSQILLKALFKRKKQKLFRKDFNTPHKTAIKIHAVLRGGATKK